jgi:hypothetical protein
MSSRGRSAAWIHLREDVDLGVLGGVEEGAGVTEGRMVKTMVGDAERRIGVIECAGVINVGLVSFSHPQ